MVDAGRDVDAVIVIASQKRSSAHPAVTGPQVGFINGAMRCSYSVPIRRSGCTKGMFDEAPPLAGRHRLTAATKAEGPT